LRHFQLLRASDQFTDYDQAGSLAIDSLPSVPLGGRECDAGPLFRAGVFVSFCGLSRVADWQKENVLLAARGAEFGKRRGHPEILIAGFPDLPARFGRPAVF
jgi:hypothetical protein